MREKLNELEVRVINDHENTKFIRVNSTAKEQFKIWENLEDT